MKKRTPSRRTLSTTPIEKPAMQRGPDRDLTFVELHYPNLNPRPHRGGHENEGLGFSIRALKKAERLYTVPSINTSSEQAQKRR